MRTECQLPLPLRLNARPLVILRTTCETVRAPCKSRYNLTDVRVGSFDDIKPAESHPDTVDNNVTSAARENRDASCVIFLPDSQSWRDQQTSILEICHPSYYRIVDALTARILILQLNPLLDFRFSRSLRKISGRFTARRSGD